MPAFGAIEKAKDPAKGGTFYQGLVEKTRLAGLARDHERTASPPTTEVSGSDVAGGIIVADQTMTQNTKSTKESSDSKPRPVVISRGRMHQILLEKSRSVGQAMPSNKNDSVLTDLTSKSAIPPTSSHSPALPHPEIIDLTDTSSEEGSSQGH